ncbi:MULTISPECIES: radical SAM/CxCxxxxC motif protein YfkAB [unclassified Paenibacillus]|uniref:radical SAM/CxCxxxxC motif protein YfkAB n=1 Tax=unclassified Paenibacillus TaxID=185978 RepID=UPI001C113706|nr:MULTISPECIES: radical SAM/CxCxxxxC motif protein YfkAB [unclassified Paenibacillus]MBU5441557.1 radical SAM/CxCxxxxC motif protein YfkAB [Paenibacillus sp. MSJ-34]CAH0117773.1 7-carboxy-7-deazaguanine synthase [Paenibacillus sp. CECT 9249]
MKNGNSVAEALTAQPLSPEYDPWDPIRSLQMYGKHVLTSVEMTVTNLCNMRCEHCAVGYSLSVTEGEHIPLELMLKRLDEVEHLETISITGGEPSFQRKTVEQYMIPLLKYARERGVRSQLNSNVTLDYERYEALAPYLDVMHISFNYTSAEDFHAVGFARTGHEVNYNAAAKLYERMIENARKLSAAGMFVSAESMINYRTHHKIVEIHRLIDEMGCRRHEVHPMYPSAFASNLPMLSLDEMRAAIHRLLDGRNPELWMLFGTLPFFRCNDNDEDRRLLRRLQAEPNVTLRNDPDGRNRLNVNLFTGDVFVTDFAAIPSFGNIREQTLDSVFNEWLRKHPLAAQVNCHCPAANCCGPNLLVADMYYKNIDFTTRIAFPDIV